MAMTLPPDGKVVACDITDKFMKDVNSQQYFKEVSPTKTFIFPNLIKNPLVVVVVISY